MTFSSSDGWPLNGPNCSVRREPLISRAKDERQQQQADARRRPRVLVAAQPAVGADDDPEGRRDRDRQEQPDELDLGEAERRPERVLGDEVLRQPLHQQQRDAAEQADDRQQDLVRPAAGEDLGEMGAARARRGRWQVCRRRQGRTTPSTVAPSEMLPTRSASATRRRAGPRASAGAAGSGRGPAAGRVAAGSRRGRRRPAGRRVMRPRPARAEAGPGRSGARRRSRAARRPRPAAR